MRYRFLLAEDHPIFSSGLRQLLEATLDWTCVGLVDTENAAIEALRNETVDIAIVDLALKQGSGLQLIQHLQAHYPRTRRVVLTSTTGPDVDKRVAAHGGAAVLSKQLHPADLLNALALAGAPISQIDDRLATLTQREREVLHLMGRGLTTSEIAEQLFVSPKTIETHRMNLKSKLGVNDVYKLMRIATTYVA